MAAYVQRQQLRSSYRLPLHGSIDLTYRCDNHCQHCWLWLGPNAPEAQKEMTLEEIQALVDSARRLGCRSWSISGGEPMLRPDFGDIFECITSRSASYSLNTNGTLITPAYAQLLKRKGTKMIALYGATADVYDHCARHKGGFEMLMQGLAYMKEAGAGFIMQIIPMRDNYHQLQQMIDVADSFGVSHRIGAAWLYLSASGNERVNRAIMCQRLEPQVVVDLDKPDMTWENNNRGDHDFRHAPGDDRLFLDCAGKRNDFHVDPYGMMSFCCFIKEPELRYNLRQGTFEDGWERFLPSLTGVVHGGQEYLEGCAVCDLRSECRWCPVYGYLEHGRFGAKVEYLCQAAEAKAAYKESWVANHRRFFQCAGMTFQVDCDLPIAGDTFDEKFGAFAVAGPGADNISIRHHFELPDMARQDLGQEVYRRPPWAIYKKGDSWIYLGIMPDGSNENLHRVAVFNHDYTRARIYTRDAVGYSKGNINAVTFFPTDQIVLAQLLADRQACYLHSSGVVLDGQGLMFVGHSEAGKSTTVKMLRDQATILCDDRNIVRRRPEGFRLHGTWSHGEVPLCSPDSAPLRAILFLVRDTNNWLAPVTNKQDITRRLLACLIKPYVTAEWWQKTLTVIEQLVGEVPCYEMHFDKSGQITPHLRALCHGDNGDTDKSGKSTDQHG